MTPEHRALTPVLRKGSFIDVAVRAMGDEIAELVLCSSSEEEAIFRCAVEIGIRDFVAATSGSSVGEEHRTSSLMGFLGTSLGYLGLIARLSTIAYTPRILWHASKKQGSRDKPLDGENFTGADFGVALPLWDRATEAWRYRVAFFQAKNSTGTDTINVWMPTGDYKRGKGRDPEAGAAEEATEADRRACHWLAGGSGKSKVSPSNSKFDHQVFKLGQLQAKVGSDRRASWVHYVIWGDEAPQCLSLDELVKPVRAKIDVDRKSKSLLEPLDYVRLLGKNLPAFRPTLSELLSGGYSNAHVGWVDLAEEQLKTLLGDFVELGAAWYIVDETEGTRSAALTDGLTEITCTGWKTAAASGDVTEVPPAPAERNAGYPAPGG